MRRSTSTPATHVEASVEPPAVRDRVDVTADEDRALGLSGSVNHWFPRVDRLLRATCWRRGRGATLGRSHVSVHATRCAPFSSPGELPEFLQLGHRACGFESHGGA
jgi:hypothetical protein